MTNYFNVKLKINNGKIVFTVEIHVISIGNNTIQA